MDRPRVGRPCDWVGVPELGLQECTTGVIVAASASLGGTVAAQSVVVGASLDTGRDRGRQGNQANRGAGERHLDGIQEMRIYSMIEIFSYRMSFSRQTVLN